ncbi:MAG: UDP-N-acetylmuramoyl-tripeptide--D-alanyl-D-alanine ligase [Anaerovoracaceae bacterium]|nr:UDP-N-acetylmuramoyl-tripeptide--D-alanyl-D-alanine ligase [Bacillota bacterium]MEE0517149.1 UDP-N-acetylmuramoyl-tripeptide--D-alanyl-D-alanine ligase [Anaerovoracaceae bacterium]
MREFTVPEIIEAVGGQLVRGDGKNKIKGISIDSREIEENMMFFAIVGENNDGHDFISQVIKKGCKVVVVSDESKVPQTEGTDVILVKNTTTALQELAKYYLRLLPLKKKIGVTGSVGKTSTRDFMYYVASTKYKTGRNKKNYNNAHGLPLSILEFDEDTEIAVLEMGMDQPGEIKLLADIVRPDIAIITKIAEVNIALMKNLDNILKAKMEITEYFDNDSTLVVNSSCPMLTPDRVGGEYNLVTVSDESGDYLVKEICDFGDKGIKYILNRDDKDYKIVLPVAGGHNAVNSALAIAAGELIGISIEEAAEGLTRSELTGKRLKITAGNGVKVVDDTYNACEDSVKSAIDTLTAIEGKRHVAILGDILGLAERAEAGHRAVGRHAAQKKIDLLIAVGDDARYYAEGASEIMDKNNIMFFSTKEEFIEAAEGIIKTGDIILVKASRGMKMEQIVNKILG